MHVLGLALNTGLEARDAADDHVPRTPAHDASAILSMTSRSVSELSLKNTRAGSPARALNLAIQTAHDERLEAYGRHTQEAVVAARRLPSDRLRKNRLASSPMPGWAVMSIKSL